MKLLRNIVVVVLVVNLMLNYGVPVIKNTGIMLFANMSSALEQKMEDLNAPVDIDTFSADMTLGELADTLKVLATSTTDEIYALYSE